jgi:hypothetical protein
VVQAEFEYLVVKYLVSTTENVKAFTGYFATNNAHRKARTGKWLSLNNFFRKA